MHRFVYVDPNLGIVDHSNPQGCPPVITQLNADENIQQKVFNLRDELTFDQGTKIILIVFYTTDKMIKTTMMYHNVSFMDCMGYVND